MRKKLLALGLIALTVFGLASCSLKKADGMNYKAVEGGIAITGYTDKTTVTELTVPDEIDGQPVIEIADFGICNAESLTKLTIGKNVKTIGTWALTNNQHLTAFKVEPANEAFTSADGGQLTKDMNTLLVEPAGKNIEFDRFGTALNETEYAVPEGVETIRSKAFYKCYYVNVTSFPDSVTRIEEKAFQRTSALTDFEMPKHLEYIGKDAFAYDEKLENLTIPASVKEIGDYAFFNCTGMKTLTVLAKEADLIQGVKWQPTAKGRINKDCTVTFAD